MATNSFFQTSYRGLAEQNLAEDLIIEAIQIYGVDVYYLPRRLFNYDEFYGDDTSSRFENAYLIEMYLKTIDNFGGDGHFLSKFGLEIRDEVVLSCSVKRFNQEVTTIDSSIFRPNEGDLIKLPKEIDHRERLFEISYVNEIEVNHQLGLLYTYEIKCKAFEYSGETFETGVDEIDAFKEDYGHSQTIFVNEGEGEFEPGEQVSQDNGFTAEVVFFSDPQLTITKIVGEYDPAQDIIGEMSMTIRSGGDIKITTGNDTGIANNDLIETESDDLIESMQNPFTSENANGDL